MEKSSRNRNRLKNIVDYPPLVYFTLILKMPQQCKKYQSRYRVLLEFLLFKKLKLFEYKIFPIFIYSRVKQNIV